MAFIPHTEPEVAAMLAVIGVASIDELFDEIPPALRVRSLDGIPAALNEMEIGRLMSERAHEDDVLWIDRDRLVRAGLRQLGELQDRSARGGE